ncbi:hypothetical protein IV203_001095 [Nitzschia inconspicua]|uniref:Sugar phosphate transporter domain-containing protein n=1 Tax=Nitzschia inconspicua TaxID=303405 RepID=A0A9K3L740_9STRA|nr:hypothetical protein IV203_001095 [Nitzschia inconspicua]
MGTILPSATPSSSPSLVLSPTSGTAFTSHGTQLGYLVFNFVSSVVITFINDAVFIKAEFGYPAYLCLNGFVATYMGTEIMRWFSLVEPIKNKVPSLLEPNFLLLVIVVGLSKTLNNASLKHNSMGFYQIFKLLVTPLVVVLEYVMDGTSLSTQRQIWLFWICLCVLLSVHGDTEFSVVGTIWASIWIPFAAIYKVQWSRVRKLYGCSTLSLMHAVMPYAIIGQLFLAPIMDPPGIRNYQWTTEAIILLTLSGLAAFFVTFSGFLVVGNVGPLAHTLLGPLKTGVAILASKFQYDTQYSFVQILGAIGALISLALYTHVTITERQQILFLPHQQYQLVLPLSPDEHGGGEVEHENGIKPIPEAAAKLLHNHIS